MLWPHDLLLNLMTVVSELTNKLMALFSNERHNFIKCSVKAIRLLVSAPLPLQSQFPILETRLHSVSQSCLNYPSRSSIPL